MLMFKPIYVPEDYWRIAVFIPFLDNLLTELSSRFTQLGRGAVQGLLLLPKSVSVLNEGKISELKMSFHEDLPEPDTFTQEVRLWKRKWEAVTCDLPQKLSDISSMTNAKIFQIIYMILTILTIIPVTLATVERSNSALRYIKTDIRSTMRQERLNSLMLLSIHKDIALDYDVVVDTFSAKHPRRLLLQNSLSD